MLNTNIGAKVDRIVGFRWDSTAGKFVQFPLQVDEKFTRFLSNNASGFAFYSGADQETNYAWDREGFRYTADNNNNPSTLDANSCVAQPAQGSPGVNAKGYSAAPDPIQGLDDNDEVAFMWRDAGADQAPSGATLPATATRATRPRPSPSGTQTTPTSTTRATPPPASSSTPSRRTAATVPRRRVRTARSTRTAPGR